jgi:hypothetical protein
LPCRTHVGVAVWSDAGYGFAPVALRQFGAPLLSLSVMCWAASGEPGGRAVLSHVATVLLYNMIVAALLVYSATISGLAGVVCGRRWSRMRRWRAGASWCCCNGAGASPKSIGARSMNGAASTRSARLPRSAALHKATNSEIRREGSGRASFKELHGKIGKV